MEESDSGDPKKGAPAWQHHNYSQERIQKEEEKKNLRENRPTSLITLTLTGGRMDRGRKDGTECCETKPYWKSSLVP